MQQKNLHLGCFWVLLSAVAYAFLAAIVKAYSQDVTTPVIVFLQIAVAFVLILLLAWRKGAERFQTIFRSPAKLTHLLRAVVSLGLNYLFFFSLKFIPVVNAMLLMNLAPLLLPFLGYCFFRTPINHRAWWPIMLSFVGVICVLRPGHSELNVGYLLALGSAVCLALVPLLVRETVKQGDNGFTTVFYFLMFGTLISGLISIPFWHAMSEEVLEIILLSGLLLFLVQYGYTESLQYIQASLTSTLFYSVILFEALLQIVLFQVLPAWTVWLGMILIILGGAWMIQLEKTQKIEA